MLTKWAKTQAFSPLFIGEVNVTVTQMCVESASIRAFSPLFIGEVNVTLVPVIPCKIWLDFQSPIHRGSKCNQTFLKNLNYNRLAFSPLFIGEVNVTEACIAETPPASTFSPLFIGEVNVTHATPERRDRG